MCDGASGASRGQYVRRPAFLAFNAHIHFARVYRGATSVVTGRLSKRATRKDDHYIDIGTFGTNITGRGVPVAVVEALDRALAWLCEAHAAHNISVALIPVLTYQRFEADPSPHGGIAASLRRLRAAGVVVLANGGNCRGWWVNCVGLPWPAVVNGITPVGSAMATRRNGHAAIELTSLTPAVGGDTRASDAGVAPPPCGHREDDALLVVAGAIFTSGALGVFAAAAVLILEAMERSGYPWQRHGTTRHDALVAIVRETGLAARPPERDSRYSTWHQHDKRASAGSSKTASCGLPHALHLERALERVLDHRN